MRQKEKINETKTWFFPTISKIHKPLALLTKQDDRDSSSRIRSQDTPSLTGGREEGNEQLCLQARLLATHTAEPNSRRREVNRLPTREEMKLVVSTTQEGSARQGDPLSRRQVSLQDTKENPHGRYTS